MIAEQEQQVGDRLQAAQDRIMSWIHQVYPNASFDGEDAVIDHAKWRIRFNLEKLISPCVVDVCAYCFEKGNFRIDEQWDVVADQPEAIVLRMVIFVRQVEKWREVFEPKVSK